MKLSFSSFGTAVPWYSTRLYSFESLPYGTASTAMILGKARQRRSYPRFPTLWNGQTDPAVFALPGKKSGLKLQKGTGGFRRYSEWVGPQIVLIWLRRTVVGPQERRDETWAVAWMSSLIVRASSITMYFVSPALLTSDGLALTASKA